MELAVALVDTLMEARNGRKQKAQQPTKDINHVETDYCGRGALRYWNTICIDLDDNHRRPSDLHRSGYRVFQGGRE
jgi:hypothetical protein